MIILSSQKKWYARWTNPLLLCASVFILVGSASHLAHADEPSLRPLNEFSSVNGVLTATMEVKAQTIDLGSGVSFDGYTYNGDYAAPLLRVHPGDIMRIKLINHLSEPTNLHFHGIHTSPLGNGDNIYTLVKPGDSFDYEVKISPDQPPGLYWYHPHIHGISERMVNGGLSGALLVEGLTQQIPSLAQSKEQVLALKLYQAETATTPGLQALHKLVQTINGQLYTPLTMRKGETQIWHILNPGADGFFHLALKDHKFRIIEWDGVTTNKETVVDRLALGPASRVTVLVDAGDQAGKFDLISEPTPTGLGEHKTDDRILGSVTVEEGEPIASVAPLTSFPDKPDLRTRKIDAYRTVVFSEEVLKDEYYVNGRLFDHDRIDTRVPLGSVEEWTIRNDSDDTHVFHIHQMHFQLVEVNGKPQPFDGYLDTVSIPERSEVKLIMPFTDPIIVGEFVYHCHVLEHEDKGMMANVEVYDPTKENRLTTLWRQFFPEVQYVGSICGSKSRSTWGKMKLWLRKEMQLNV